MTWDWARITLILTGIGYLLPIIMLFIVPTNRKPSSATAWLLLIVLLPYLGLLIYLLIGSPKLPAYRRARQRTATEMITAGVEEARANPEAHPGELALLDPPIAERYQPFVALNTHLGGLPAYAGNQVELLPDYAGSLARIAEAINEARYFVHIEYFIIAMDDATEACFAAMEAAAQRGVKVRVLLDQLGSSSYPHYKEMLDRMTKAGIEWHLMLPVKFFSSRFTRPDLRNHRKIVVVDGLVGFTGSQNLIDRTYHKKKNLKKGLYYTELVARVTGPVVRQFNALFMTDWYSETDDMLLKELPAETRQAVSATGEVLCQTLPSGPGFPDDNNLKLYTQLISAANYKLTIANPYFVPDDALMTAITTAAQRGVDVTLISSEIGDQFLVYNAQRSYYEQLLRAGVKVYLYRSPILLHSKHLSVDDDIAVIGSSNLDLRSFTLNLEVTLVCYDKSVVASMQPVFESYLARAKRLDLEEWVARPTMAKLAENISRLTAALQ
ncbi:MAG TPA: cardiolipin synthase [Ktedonobacterales bacterium]|jgi:cardiolipin synthase A/B|nr:cardiolipin synthase [Ktedonobacterales bacterium]